MITAIEEPDPDLQFPYPCPGYVPRGTLPGNTRYQSFLAERVTDGQPVVLDLITPEFAPPPAEQMEIESRLQKLLGLQHPGILRLSDIERPDNHYVLVHEDEPMQALPAYLAQHGAPGLESSLEILSRLSDALSYAWRRKNLAHQELQVASIVMDRDHQARIRDLGLAEVFPDPARPAGRIDPRSDMLGLVQIFRRLINSEECWPEDLPPHIEKTLTKMEADEIHKRPANWDEVCDGLRNPGSGAPPRSQEVSKEWHVPVYKPQKGLPNVRSTRARLVLIGVILLSTLLAAGLLVGAEHKKNRHARGQLKRTLKFQSTYPDKLNDIVDQYNRILDRDIDPDLEQQVRDHLAKAEAARAAAVLGVLSKLDDAAAQAIQISDFGAAAHAYNVYDGPHVTATQPHRASRVRLIERMTSQSPNGIRVNADEDPVEILVEMMEVNPASLEALEPTMRLQLAQRARMWQDQYRGLMRFVASSSPYNAQLVDDAANDLSSFDENHKIPRDAVEKPPILNAIHAWARRKRQEIQRQIQALSKYYSKNQPAPSDTKPK